MTTTTPRPFAVLYRLLAPSPDAAAAELTGRPSQLVVYALFSLIGLALYGAAAGLFQGGPQILVAAGKAPLIVGFTLLLTIPSLAVGTGLAGVSWSSGRLLGAATAFLAALTLSLLALLPVVWLFSVSSRHLASPTLIHTLVWLVAVLLARRVLRSFSGETGVGPLRLWTALFFIVSLQATTFVQPILYRGPDEPLFPTPRQLFLQHFARAAEISLPETPERPPR